MSHYIGFGGEINASKLHISENDGMLWNECTANAWDVLIGTMHNCLYPNRDIPSSSLDFQVMNTKSKQPQNLSENL